MDPEVRQASPEDTQPFRRSEVDALLRESGRYPVPDYASPGVIVIDGDGELD